jgi:hypothetical protein
MTPIRFGLLALLSMTGCVVHTDGAHEGAVTLTWTIDGVDDPAECRQGDVDLFVVHIETSDGDFGSDYDALCEDFAVTIELPSGDYHADAVLVDSRGREVTTAIATDDFAVYPGEEEVIDLDFPADSFL